MDLEKAVEFIVEQQAKNETRFDAITTLIHGGMRIIVDLSKRVTEIADFQKQLAESYKQLVDSQIRLAESQKETERKLQALLDSLRKSTNGN